MRTSAMVYSYAAFFILAVISANAEIPCEPKQEIVSNLEPSEINRCLHFTWFSLGRKIKVDEKFVGELLEALLPTTEDGIQRRRKFHQFDIDYGQISEIISLLKSENLIKRYIDFIIFTKYSADEVRSFGLGELYTLQAPVFLNILSKYSKPDRDIVISSLSWGLINNFYPHINSGNYQRLIVGEYWELVDAKHPNRALSKIVENEVYKIISATKWGH